MTPAPFPKLLVATEFSPNASGGGAVIMRQMLKEWPVEKLYWWSCLPDVPGRFGQKVADHRLAAVPLRLYPNRRFSRARAAFMGNLWTPWATRHFNRTLELFKPDVVWTVPHLWSIPPVYRALQKSAIGFHTSIHDYMRTRAWTELYGERRITTFTEMTEWLYANAHTRDGISDSMVEDLKTRTHKDGLVCHSGLEPEEFEYLAAKPEVEPDRIRIVYAGTISVESAFEKFVEALRSIRGRLAKPVTIELYGSHTYKDRQWFDAGWMTEGGNLPAAELTRTLRGCTWGFVPMSLLEEDASHLFSLPTKFTSYLSAGLPVITIGHPKSGLIQMAQKYNVGICVPSDQCADLPARLLAKLSDPNPWRTYRAEIMRCARAEYDVAKIRRDLYACFDRCAQKTNGRERRL